MTYPLPIGVCRTVCRTKTAPMDAQVVARMAKSAVKNGDDPCLVVELVRIATGCRGECTEEAQNVEVGLDALREAVDELESALLDLLRALNLKGPPSNDPLSKESLLERILKYLKFLSSLKKLVSAILDVWDAYSRFLMVFRQFIDDVAALIRCLRKGK